MGWRWVGAGGAHRGCDQRFLRRQNQSLRQMQIHVDADLRVFAGWRRWYIVGKQVERIFRESRPASRKPSGEREWNDGKKH
jgi:hypothetical protein